MEADSTPAPNVPPTLTVFKSLEEKAPLLVRQKSNRGPATIYGDNNPPFIRSFANIGTDK
jgi:hypothetical protein